MYCTTNVTAKCIQQNTFSQYSGRYVPLVITCTTRHNYNKFRTNNYINSVQLNFILYTIQPVCELNAGEIATNYSGKHKLVTVHYTL